MFFLPSYTGFLSPKSWGLKCCTMYSTTSLLETTNRIWHWYARPITLCWRHQLNPSPDQNALLWSEGEGSSQDYGILIALDAAAGCSCWTQYLMVMEREARTKGGRVRAGGHLSMPWPSHKRGGWGLVSEKERSKGLTFLYLLGPFVSKPQSQRTPKLEDSECLTRWYKLLLKVFKYSCLEFHFFLSFQTWMICFNCFCSYLCPLEREES